MRHFAVLVFVLSALVSHPASSDMYSEGLTPSQADRIAELARQNLENIKSLRQNSERIIGLELIVPNASAANVFGYFSHAMLRLVDDDDDIFNDRVVTFGMQALNEEEFFTKALEGGWANLPEVDTFASRFVDYSKKGLRGMNRFILPSSREQIDLLLKNLETVAQVPTLVGTYKFLDNNCFTALMKLLGSSGYPVQKRKYYVPVQAESYLRYGFLTALPKLHMSVPVALIKEFDEIFDRDEEPLQNQKLVTYLKKLSTEDLVRALMFWPHKWALKKIQLMNEFKSRTDRTSYDLQTLMGYTSADANVYIACSLKDTECRRRRVSAVRETWSPEELSELHRSWNLPLIWHSEYERAGQLHRGDELKGLLEHPIVQDNLKLGHEVLSGRAL